MRKKLKDLITRLYLRWSQLQKQHKLTSLVVMVTLTLCACGSRATRVSIPIKVQSEIDISNYSNFAVLPFVHEKRDSRTSEIALEMGDEIAEILRGSLARQKHFDVVDKQETTRLMTGEEVTEAWLDDTERLRELGRYFEVKGLIVGSYRFYTDSRPRRYYGERYSVQHQRYIMDYQDYLQKTYLLSLRVLIVDVDTEEVIWDETYQRSTAEAHSIGSFVFSQMAPQEATVRELSRHAVSEFTRRISPHYEQVDRYLVQ